MPAGQLADCSWQAVARPAPPDEGVAVGAKEPGAQAVQTRSATAVPAAEKNVPAGHVADVVEGQAKATLKPAAEDVLEAEKVLGAHGLHVRSPVGVAGALKNVPGPHVVFCAAHAVGPGVVAKVDAEKFDEKVFGGQKVQVRSAEGVAASR